MFFPVPDISWLEWVWPVTVGLASFGLGYIVGGCAQRG